MNAIVKFDGWDLDASGDEPRVRDLDLGIEGGLARPRDIRQLIERNWDTLLAFGEIKVCGTTPRTSGGRPGREYWLNEEQAVSVGSMIKTERGRLLHVRLVKLFVAYRRGQLAGPVTVDMNLVHGPNVGQVPDLRAEVVEECQLVVLAAKLTLSRVHGVIRQIYRVPSVYFLSTLEWPNAKRTLRALALGKLHVKVPPPPKQLPADRRQVSMPWRSN